MIFLRRILRGIGGGIDREDDTEIHDSLHCAQCDIDKLLKQARQNREAEERDLDREKRALDAFVEMTRSLRTDIDR